MHGYIPHLFTFICSVRLAAFFMERVGARAPIFHSGGPLGHILWNPSSNTVYELSVLPMLRPVICELSLLPYWWQLFVCVCAGVGGFKWCTWFCWVCLLLPAATMEGSKFFFFLMRLLIPFIVSSSLFSPPSILDVSCHCRHPSWGFEPVTQLEALFKLGKMVHALAMSPQRGREPWSVDTIQHLRAKLAGLGQHLSSIQRTNNFYPQRRRTLSGSLSKSPSHDTGAIQEAVLSLS